MAMISISRKEYLGEVQKQYVKANKNQKSGLLAAAVIVTGMNRKYLIGVLGSTQTSQTTHRLETRGRKTMYGLTFHVALLTCWHAANDICAERLQPFLPELVPKLETYGELRVDDTTRLQLLSASRATVSRHLKQAKRRSILPLGTTRPGSLIKSQVAVRRGRWEESSPGWVETDTVAHGGETNAGQFIYTYNFIDIATAWCEQIAVLGKGEQATVTALSAVRQRFPFPLLGIDSDNGYEYLNDHLMYYCRRENLSFTRSRPYEKNDNAHVEQKNWEAIRKVVGYSRLDTKEQLQIMTELYSGPLRLYLNYFQPTRKRKAKHSDMTTGQKRKFYFEARTPYQRVMDQQDTSQATKDLLTSEYNQLNPVKLLDAIHTLIDQLNRTLR